MLQMIMKNANTIPWAYNNDNAIINKDSTRLTKKFIITLSPSMYPAINYSKGACTDTVYAYLLSVSAHVGKTCLRELRG